MLWYAVGSAGGAVGDAVAATLADQDREHAAQVVVGAKRAWLLASAVVLAVAAVGALTFVVVRP